MRSCLYRFQVRPNRRSSRLMNTRAPTRHWKAGAKEARRGAARGTVAGGAIALGPPLGAGGARILPTRAHDLRRRNHGARQGGARYGLATMCLGVGQGIATIVEYVA